MNQNEKKVVFIIIAVLLIVMIGTIIFTTSKKKDKGGENVNNLPPQVTQNDVEIFEDGTKLNTNTEFNKVKKYKDLEFTDIQFTFKNGNSVLLAKVVNKGTTTHEPELVTISIIGKDGQVLETLEPIIGKINPGESTEINLISMSDLINAKDFTIKSK